MIIYMYIDLIRFTFFLFPKSKFVRLNHRISKLQSMMNKHLVVNQTEREN